MTHRKQYEAWIDDAAVGALDPRRERELLAHTNECDGCREAYQHARELAALVDRGVESLVAGEPSPHFATHLRGRIAQEQPASRSMRSTWTPAAAGLVSAVAIAVLIVLLLPKHRRFEPNAVRPNLNMTSSAHIQSPVAVERPATNPPRQAGQSQVRDGYAPRPQVARRTTPSRVQLASRFGSHDKHAVRLSWASRKPDARAPGPSLAVSRHKSPADPEVPEVIVPPGQLAAVMQLAADIRSGRIDGKQFLAEQAEAQKNMQQPIDIAPIEIKPIEIPPLPVKPAETPSDPTPP